jgi:NAD(P)-dependent dehydrogenase (short-subunit alcohol dehydrogenase family)
VVTCDITDRDALAKAIEDARTANGPLDYVILNAGIADSAPFGRTSRESYDRIIATNLTAVFDGAQLALPDLLQGEDKRLVVVASVAGLGGIALAAPYAASKHGAVGLVRSLALEFAKTNLTVNAVCPAFVDTPMTDASADRISERTGRTDAEAREALANLNPNGRLVTPDEVAASILHLCHPSSRSITGSCLTIDGGATA